MGPTIPAPVIGDDTASPYIDAAASLLGLTVLPEWRDDVLFHLKTIAAAAHFVEAYPLSDESEPAPVFKA